MLKDIIGNSIAKIQKVKDKENKKKGDKAPFQYSNELEITVSKSNKPIQVFTHK